MTPRRAGLRGKSRGWMVEGERQAGSGIFPGSVAHLPTEPGPGRGLSLWVNTRRHRHARAQGCSGPSVSQLAREDAWFAHKCRHCALFPQHLPTLQRDAGLLNTPVAIQLWMERHHSLQEPAKRCQVTDFQDGREEAKIWGDATPPSPVRGTSEAEHHKSVHLSVCAGEPAQGPRQRLSSLRLPGPWFHRWHGQKAELSQALVNGEQGVWGGGVATGRNQQGSWIGKYDPPLRVGSKSSNPDPHTLSAPPPSPLVGAHSPALNTPFLTWGSACSPADSCRSCTGPAGPASPAPGRHQCQVWSGGARGGSNTAQH